MGMSMPGYYRVQVKAIFDVYNEHFQPGQIYWVSAEHYNGQLPDGRNFKDLCATADLEPQSSGI